MRHLRKGRKLSRTASHRKALLRKLATDLFEHKRIITTEAKAKELRPYAEKLISKAKHALVRENQGQLDEGQTIDVHNRRMVARDIKNKEVLQELFDVIAPAVEDRNGGYTRIVKLEYRRGDNASTALIELVDWSAPQDGQVSMKTKKKKSKPKPAATKPEIVEEEVDDTIEDVSTDEEIKEEVETAETEEKKEEEVKEEVETAETEEKKEEEVKEEAEDKTEDKEADSNEDPSDKTKEDDKKKDE